MSQTSKQLSYILRHNPGAYDLVMDKQGWVDVQPLVDALCINIATLVGVVNTDSKGRFEFSSDGHKIRATQGHSVDVQLDMVRMLATDEKVYHGTATRFLASIMEKGLLPGERQHVHMVSDFAQAFNVGTRHGVPAVLSVDLPLLLEETNIAVYHSTNGYVLAEHIPAKYLKIIKGDSHVSI